MDTPTLLLTENTVTGFPSCINCTYALSHSFPFRCCVLLLFGSCNDTQTCLQTQIARNQFLAKCLFAVLKSKNYGEKRIESLFYFGEITVLAEWYAPHVSEIISDLLIKCCGFIPCNIALTINAITMVPVNRCTPVRFLRAGNTTHKFADKQCTFFGEYCCYEESLLC